MTGPDVPDSDMLNVLWRSKADVPPVGDPALDSLLEPSARPEDAADPLYPVAEVLAALHAGPDGAELAGFDRALAAFRIGGTAPEASARPRRRPATFRRVLRARLAAAIAVAVAAIGAISYAGALPAMLQQVAHETIGAPAAPVHGNPHPAPRAATTAEPAGRGQAGSAAYGLCNAYQHALADGNKTQQGVAFRNLAAAAGGQDKISAYCASVPHPGATTPPGKAVGHTSHTPPGKAVGHSSGDNSKSPASGNGKGSGNGNGNGDGHGNGKSQGNRNQVSR